MKITAARVIVCAPGRNFVTLKIETDQGLHGIGDATLNGREMSVVAYLQDHVLPCLIGRDAHAVEDIWQYLYRGAYWRRGPVTMAAIAAVDVALWDLKAKAAALPLYQLLGGASRTRMLCYPHASGADLPELLERIAALRAQGHRAARVQCGIPGLGAVYGVRGGGLNQPAGMPAEQEWDIGAYMRFAPHMLAEVRDAVGETFELLHDTHHRIPPIDAARLAREVEPLHLFWLEDLVPAENPEVYRLIRAASTTRLALGEVFNTIHDCREVIQQQLIDFIRASPLHAGGITHIRRIADFAALWQIRTACHGAPDMSPVTFGASLHFDRWVPNFGIQEYAGHPPETAEVFRSDWSYDGDGHLLSGEAPGHGVDIDEVAAARFPYRRSYLATARLADGTAWNY